MIKKFYSKLVSIMVASSLKYTYTKLLILLLISLPGYFLLKQIEINTNLLNLLPESNRSSELNRELKEKIGDGGHFIVFYEGDDPEVLKRAVRETAEEVKKFDEVRSVQYQHPKEFINKYKYFLIPTDYLNDLYDRVLSLEAEYSPFVDNLLGGMEEEDKDKTRGAVEDNQELQILLMQYNDLTEYHQSKDGTIFGMIIPTKHGVTSIGKVRELYNRIESVTGEISQKYDIWSGIGGNHVNKLNEYDIIISDLNRSGIIASVLILIILILSFRRISSVFVVLVPLFFGLVWAFSLVPYLTGELNLITSFLILILFGMGVDYSIHILKRFQFEIQERPLKEALLVTYESTGLSVVISAVTTAFALSLLSFSDFKGFSEFGLISSVSVITVLLAMFLVLPPLIILFYRWGFLKNLPFVSKVRLLPNRIVTFSIIVLTLVSAYLSIQYLGFDYNLANLDFDKASDSNTREIKRKHEQVYSISMSPAAIYLADDKESLDSFLKKLNTEKNKDTTMIGRVRSIRDFAPKGREVDERLRVIRDIKDVILGDWIENIDDTSVTELIKDFRAWEIPSNFPEPKDIPDELAVTLRTNADHGYLINVNPKKERKDGRNAMALTSDLYAIDNVEGVKGPVGETIIYAELLWLVLGESWWIACFTLLGIFLIVWIIRRSLMQTVYILIPLIAGLALTLGLLAILDFKLSFFNLVVIPALLGIGVDGGVHYTRKWKESGWNVLETQKELFEPLTVATLTTLLGYSGMIFAHHSGIRSIGIFACIGLVVILFTTLILLPGILKYFAKEK